MAVYMAFYLYLICFDTVCLDPMSDVDNFRMGYKRGSGPGVFRMLSWKIAVVVGAKWTVMGRERGICSSSGLEPLRSPLLLLSCTFAL